LGFASSYAVAIIAVLLISGMAALSDILSQSLMQSAVPNELRGRAMGSWVLATGFGPLGNLQVGAVAAAFGVTAALMANGLGLAALAGLSLVLLSRLRRL
ncbi:MAG: hypothetical protein L0177_20950, partial [Chloroflexi bacterium]|nr:hypothetical protein [Chloroflexota bacterium]